MWPRAACASNCVRCCRTLPAVPTSAGAQPLAWMLLTSLPALDAAQAWQIVGHDRQRWQIERFFHVLKQGCRVEQLQL